jgi:hypothetical protein
MAKRRNLLILIHLYLAATLAPLFVLVAITGGLYLADFKPETKQTALSLPAGTRFDPESPQLEAQVAAVLAKQGLDIGFEYLRTRPGSIITRPTTRTYVEFSQEDSGWSATLHEPDLHYAALELHKGHGPGWFKIYQIGAAIALFLVVLGGLLVGLLAKAYRRQTVTAFTLGTAAFAVLGFLL